MLKKPKLIIFDLDGTLVEFPLAFMFDRTQKVIQELDHPQVPHHHLMDCFSDFDFFRFVEDSYKDKFITKFVEEISNYSHQAWESAIALPGSILTLKELQQREIKIAIATSRTIKVEDLKNSLDTLGFMPYISLVTVRDGEHVSFKDKTKQLNEIFNHFGFNPQDCYKVGDVPSDISCAKEMGIGATVAVLSGNIKHEVLAREKPDIIIPDITHLSRIIID